MKKPSWIFVLFVFLLVSGACAVPVETRWNAEPTQAAGAGASGAADDPAAATAAAETAVAANPADAEITGDVPAISTPIASARVMPQGVVNIMVLGSDWRASSGHRTDVIMLVSVNTAKQTVSAVSFPRDLYVPIPGWTTQRINTAEPHGGFAMLQDTMEQNFGVRPDYYIMTDFRGFTGIVDSLGGVDVYAGSRLSDACDLPQADNGKCTIQPGLNHMDGGTALWYIRSRHTSSDLDRQRREQEVLMGMFVKLMSLNALENLPNLYQNYQSSVKTDLTLQAMTPLLPTAAKVFSDRGQIHRYALTVKEAQPYVTESGAQVLLPDYGLIGQILDEAVFAQ